MAVRVEEEIMLESDKNVTPGPSIPSWETQKENIQPIRQGRKIETLMAALDLVTNNESRRELIVAHNEEFEKNLEACQDLYEKMDLWSKHIDWLEQNIPDGGKVNGLSEAIENCIESYYDKKEFKQDERLFEVFLKFLRFCDEPIEVFGFMYANSICTLLARFYLNWSWQYEIRKNVRRAEDLIKLGLKNLASPREVLEEARGQLKARIDRMIMNGQLDEECIEGTPLNTRVTQAKLESHGIRAALQTLKFKVTKKEGLKVPVTRVGLGVEHVNVGGLKNQTKIVNGVRVPKPQKKISNKPIPVLAEEAVNEDAENEGVAVFKDKIPTSQRIQQVGRTGVENRPRVLGTIATTSKPPPAS